MYSEEKLNIVFFYCTENYPLSFSANNTKISMTAKQLTSLGHSVAIVNHPKFVTQTNCIIEGRVKIYNFLRKESNRRQMGALLQQLKCKDRKNIVILSCGSITNLYRCFLAARGLDYKVGYIYQEWHWHLEHNLKGKLNALFCDWWLIRKYDFILPISDFLTAKIEHIGIPHRKFPIMAKFPDAPSPNKQTTANNIVYCASVEYRDTLMLILKAFSLLHESVACYLNIVLGGSPEKIDTIKSYVKSQSYGSSVCIMSHVPAETLTEIYQSANILLIPLNPNNIADKARFSQKTAEYLTTGNPVITTPVGEMPLYFRDGETMFFCNYEPQSLADKCANILDNKNEAQRVGLQGFEYGRSQFDVKIVVAQLVDFLLYCI